MENSVNIPKFSLPKYNKEETINRILAIISRYNQKGDFVLGKIDYQEQQFEDMLIEIGTKTDLHFTIVRDRYQIYMSVENIGKPRWYYIEDVLQILEIQYKPVPVDTDIVEGTEKYMEILVENIIKLQEAFNKKNRVKTISKIEEFLDDRLKQNQK
jgi:hypothetical protein